MIEIILLGGALVAVACVAFVASIRLGMLIGLRIDRRMDAGGENEPAPELDMDGATATQSQNLEGRLGE